MSRPSRSILVAAPREMLARKDPGHTEETGSATNVDCRSTWTGSRLVIGRAPHTASKIPRQVDTRNPRTGQVPRRQEDLTESPHEWDNFVLQPSDANTREL